MVEFAALVLLFVQPAAERAEAPQPELEMMTYQMVFLHRVPGVSELPESQANAVQEAHLAHLARLNRERVNLLYGPFLDDGPLRGIAVLDVASAEEAKRLFAEDPHVKAGRLAVDVKPWMGPKGWFHPPDKPETPEQLVFGFLKSGPNRSQSKEEAQALQKAHLAYMDDLHEQGRLIMAGPFLDDTEWRGVVVYRVASVDEARDLASGDPMVKAGRLAIDARPWMTFRGILR
jgi:uncharacterized protein YciI